MRKWWYLLMFACWPALAADISTDAVLLQALDKTTGRTSFLTVKIDEPYAYGDLVVTVEKCMKHPPEETPENSVFLTVSEQEKNIFRGWMFSSNPALSAMDHPVYDIWVVECITPNKVHTYTPETTFEEIEEASVAVEDLED